MCNLYSITKNQDAIRQVFRVTADSAGNLGSMPGVFPDYEAPVIRNQGEGRELIKMRWGKPPPPQFGGAPITNIRICHRRIGAAGSNRKIAALCHSTALLNTRRSKPSD